MLTKFATYCKTEQNVPFERYRFNRSVQEPGESNDQYRTALRKLAEGCSFNRIMPEEILRDRLVFGIRDAKVRRKLLLEMNLTLKKMDKICCTSESTAEQIKVVEENPETKQVNAKQKRTSCRQWKKWFLVTVTTRKQQHGYIRMQELWKSMRLEEERKLSLEERALSVEIQSFRSRV